MTLCRLWPNWQMPSTVTHMTWQLPTTQPAWIELHSATRWLSQHLIAMAYPNRTRIGSHNPVSAAMWLLFRGKMNKYVNYLKLFLYYSPSKQRARAFFPRVSCSLLRFQFGGKLCHGSALTKQKGILFHVLCRCKNFSYCFNSDVVVLLILLAAPFRSDSGRDSCGWKRNANRRR